jgi:hypothetical protein
MSDVVSGAIIMGYLLAGLFFLRFWRRSRDTLFAYFAAAFWILGAQRLGLAWTGEEYEYTTIFYIIRLTGFLLILMGIWQKNRPR